MHPEEVFLGQEEPEGADFIEACSVPPPSLKDQGGRMPLFEE